MIKKAKVYAMPKIGERRLIKDEAKTRKNSKGGGTRRRGRSGRTNMRTGVFQSYWEEFGRLAVVAT